MKVVFGIDIGGTQVKGRAFGRDGAALATDRRPLGEGREGPERLKATLDALREGCGREPDGLGIAAPGVANREETRIISLPGDKVALENLDWADYLGFSRPLHVLNDAHAALMGELWQGAARGLSNAVMVTLGTGVGGALLAEGRLLKGRAGRAGSVGHLCMDPDAPKGICSMPGSLEDYIGEQTVRERSGGRFDSTRDLVDAAQAGDAGAQAVWARSVHVLACGLGSLINVADPEAIVIGGGIAQAGDSLFEPLRQELGRIEWRPTGEAVKLIPAQLGEWSGAFGAAYRLIEQHEYA